MKQKIRVLDYTTGKTTELEVSLRDYDHFLAQKRYKSAVFRDRTKYSRKEKHKQKYF